MKRPLAAAIALALALGSAIGAETSGTGRLVLHLDFNTIQMTKAAVLSSLRSAAAFGFDTVLWEIENKVRWECCPECVHPEAFTKDEFRELLAEADRLGLKAIPLMQTFGHAEYVLMDGQHPDWMEDPSFPACYCVSNPEVRRFLKALLHEYLGLFGSRVKDFHLGGDEALAFGKCPACKARGRMDLYVEHLEAVAAELREKGIRPGVWHDMVLGAETDAERAKLPRDYAVWYWNYAYDGKADDRCRADVEKLQKGGWPVVLSAATASWGDGPFLPRYGFHSRNIAACAALARERNLKGLCVTSWSLRQLSKALQAPLWEFAARRYRTPAESAEADLSAVFSRAFGALGTETLVRLTDWDSKLTAFDGTGWFPFIKSARPAPAGTRTKVVKDLRKDTALRQRVTQLASALRKELPTVRQASRNPLARELAEGAELTQAFLNGIEAALDSRETAALPLARTQRHFKTWQSPASASNSCAITWSVLGAPRQEELTK